MNALSQLSTDCQITQYIPVWAPMVRCLRAGPKVAEVAKMLEVSVTTIDDYLILPGTYDPYFSYARDVNDIFFMEGCEYGVKWEDAMLETALIGEQKYAKLPASRNILPACNIEYDSKTRVRSQAVDDYLEYATQQINPICYALSSGKVFKPADIEQLWGCYNLLCEACEYSGTFYADLFAEIYGAKLKPTK